MAHVLVVDDEPDIRGLVRMTLELAGHEVSEAADGAEALRALQSATHDAVVLDVAMPVLGGWDVLARLKGGGGPLASVPVIMLTAFGGELDRIRGGIEGAVRYVTKPFDPDDLRDAVRLVLEEGPEPEQRRRAQQRALERLAALERGGPAGDAPSAGAPVARPRLTKLGTGAQSAPSRPRARRLPPAGARGLSPRQEELLGAVAAAPTVLAAAERLGVSRSNVYASLRRIARRLEVGSVSELVALTRAKGDDHGR